MPANVSPDTYNIGGFDRGPCSNATLGFEKILAVSPRPSWRTRGLEAAAQKVGLDITILPQPEQSDSAIEELQHRKKGLPYGSAKAWLSHVEILQHIVASGYETALIVEDDADWDVRLKDQVLALSDAMRELNKQQGGNLYDHHTIPYGDSNHWDILWLGHCGSTLEKPSLQYADPSRTPNDQYVQPWGDDLVDKNLPDGQRRVHRSVWQVCTWAYAVTRQGAANLLMQLKPPRPAVGFDISVSEECHSLRCLTVNPSIFASAHPAASENYLSIINSEDRDPKDTGLDDVYEDQMGFTKNIVQSARCMALWGKTCPKKTGPKT